VAASLIDTLFLLLVLAPLLYLTDSALLMRLDGIAAPATDAGGLDVLVKDLVPMVLVVFFWVRYGGTPGKKLMSCRVVDLRTGKNPRVGRAILRYIGYFVSILPLFLGIFWVAWDRRKQGFHDKIAGTVVVVQDAPPADDESQKSLEQLIKEAS
jgi:uncharacterized RDD family membrane protein YckC